MVVLVHKRLLVMIVCLAFYQYTTFAQSITELQNKPHIGDKIERQVIEGIYCGKKGDHILWDFSNCTFKEENSPIRVASDSLGFHCSEAGLQSYYLLSGDSLLKHAFRSKLEEITYKKPQIAMLYPFTYSDSISSSFYGEGTFCDTNGNFTFYKDKTSYYWMRKVSCKKLQGKSAKAMKLPYVTSKI